MEKDLAQRTMEGGDEKCAHKILQEGVILIKDQQLEQTSRQDSGPALDVAESIIRKHCHVYPLRAALYSPADYLNPRAGV
jgi:hypothetical protein